MPLVRVTVVLGAVGLAAFATLAALPVPASDDVGAPIFGFSRQTVASQLNVERRIKGLASTTHSGLRDQASGIGVVSGISQAEALDGPDP